MPPSHSASSSLADFDYYGGAATASYSHHSPSSSYSASSANPPPLRPGSASQQQQPSTSNGVRKQTSLANISVPSFSAFRNQVSGIPISSPSTGVRRKQPPGQAQSPRVVSFSAAEKGSPRLAEPGARPYSIESPAITQPTGLASVISPPLTENDATPQGDRTSFSYPISIHSRNDSIDSRIAPSNRASSAYSDSRRSSIPIHARYAQEQTIAHAPKLSVCSVGSGSQYSTEQRRSTGPMTAVQAPPNMTLQFEGVQRTLSDESLRSTDSDRPKSPGGRLGNIFGWKSSSQRSGVDSPTTTISDHSQSPLPSPNLSKPLPMDPNGKLTPPGLDVHKANAHQPSYFDNPETPILIGTPTQAVHVRELERELAQVSTELAESIRREMELEDEVERLRMEAPAAQPEQGRRGSDYFSDSGASSTRFPITDPDGRMADLEKSLRKAEQEKAQFKNDMASRLQTELSRRRDLEQMVQKMEEQLKAKFEEESQRDMSERVEELESTLEDTRRLLNQERQAKGSFEDLYTATRGELESSKNERDNLRDEVVPQLRARLDGLEAESADTQALMYENTRMQQELAGLKERFGGRFGMIAEEGDGISSPKIGPRAGLSRSNSLARTGSKRGGSLTRSGSVKERDAGSGRGRSGSLTGPLNADAVKEIEDQRDALHKALKLLISRYEKQQKAHATAVKKLTAQKNVAEHASPGRSAYQKEVSFLKEEVTTLRKRTEDALEQKWQYEKGLSGIKMDLDRAEQETRGLRILLQENDILAPSPTTLAGARPGSSGSYEDKLSSSISLAEKERDQARQAAEEYRQRAESASSDNSEELLSSAKRMEELADQLDVQVQSNSELRDRLSLAVEKGEKEQKETSGKIEEMQRRLAGMEDSVLAAQQHSETTLTNHETEARRIDEATSPSLQRLRIDIPDPSRLSPHSPMMARSPFTAKSPKLTSKKLADTSLLEASRTQMLERKVRELEGLLREAEEDMQDVVQRVNASQIEVAELQTQRDVAMGQMRKLQALVEEERGRAEGLM